MPTSTASAARIVHVITSLGLGGAERVLVKLLDALRGSATRMEVITLRAGGALEDDVRALGIPLRSLDMRPGVPSPAAALRLRRMLGREQPDVVVGWMYHANLLAGWAARRAGRIPVVWNIQQTHLTRDISPLHTRVTNRACAALSRRYASQIVFVSHAARQVHVEQGYDAARSVVLPSGFDLDVFRPDGQARRGARQELALPPQTPLVGLAGRFHPNKDHESFLQAAERVRVQRPDVHFVLVGPGVDAANRTLVDWIESRRLAGAVHLLGPRRDMPRIYAALDLSVLSSVTEGFPNVVGEAMACGTPCVVTDVGDSAMLVGATGRAVPPRHPEALADAMLDLLSLPPRTLHQFGMAARRRIAEHFELHHVARQHLELWLSAAQSGRSDRGLAAPGTIEQQRTAHTQREAA